MCCNDGAHVGHTAVANLNIIPIEQLVVFVVLLEVLTDQPEEPAGDVGGDILAVGGVEPYYVPLTLPFGAPGWLGRLGGGMVTTPLQGVLVVRHGLIELVLVAG